MEFLKNLMRSMRESKAAAEEFKAKKSEVMIIQLYHLLFFVFSVLSSCDVVELVCELPGLLERRKCVSLS